MPITDTWTTPSSLDRNIGDILTETIWDALVSNELYLFNRAAAGPPSCRAHRTTTLSIATTHTVIGFDSESGDWDTSAIHDTVTNNNRFTAPIAGVYAFFCSATITQGAGNTSPILQARDSSANGLARANGVPNATNSVAEMTVAGQVKLAANDWIEFTMAVNGTGTGTLSADSASTPCKAGLTWLSAG